MDHLGFHCRDPLLIGRRQEERLAQVVAPSHSAAHAVPSERIALHRGRAAHEKLSERTVTSQAIVVRDRSHSILQLLRHPRSLLQFECLAQLAHLRDRLRRGCSARDASLGERREIG
eukprot:4485280-Prymnesium_polylepis.1